MTEKLLHHAFLHCLLKLALAALGLMLSGCEATTPGPAHAAPPRATQREEPARQAPAVVDLPLCLKRLDAAEKEICRLNVEVSKLRAQAAKSKGIPSSSPPKAWQRANADPESVVPLTFITASWCTVCPRAKAEIQDSTLFYVATTETFDPQRHSWVKALPTIIWTVNGQRYYTDGWEHGVAGLKREYENTLRRGDAK